MRVDLASDAGHPGRANEDFVGAVPGAVVLLDGAGIPGTESICAHGVAWYTHRLGGALLGRLSRADGQGLDAILAAAIDEVAAGHRDTCDLAHPNSPQATVAIVRAYGERVDHLLLADTFVVLDRAGSDPRVLTDEREVATRRRCLAPLADVPPDVPPDAAAYGRIRDACVEALRACRNRPGGYWIAKDDPRAAAEAVTGSRPLTGLDGVALLSNGASRVVDPYGLTDWRGVLDLLRAGGPAEIVRRVREAEARADADVGAYTPDDATVALWTRPTGRS